MERYPVIVDGELTGWIASSSDFTGFYGPGGRLEKLYFWVSSRRAVRVDDEMRGWVLDGVNVRRHYEDLEWPLAYSFGSLDDAVEMISRELGDKLRGRRVMASFSGGKDSCATLSLLVRLSEKIGFRLRAAYSYVPYLEPAGNVGFVEKAAEKIGFELDVYEASRLLVKSRLEEDGLPKRGARWCTYLKVKPIREARRREKPDYIVDSDRMAESWKRLLRYAGAARKLRLLSEPRLHPTYYLTLLDVVRECRRLGLVHPDYLGGSPRMACLMCPYRSLHEFPENYLDRLEDPGLIESAMRREHAGRYCWASWAEFEEQQLWRLPPRHAKATWLIRRRLSAKRDEISSETVAQMLSSVWREKLPPAPVLGPRTVAGKILELNIPRIMEVREETLPEKVSKPINRSLPSNPEEEKKCRE